MAAITLIILQIYDTQRQIMVCLCSRTRSPTYIVLEHILELRLQHDVCYICFHKGTKRLLFFKEHVTIMLSNTTFNNISAISYALVVRAGLSRCGVQCSKICSVLLCVLEQPRVDNSNVWPLKREIQLGGIGPNGLMPGLVISFVGVGNRSSLRRCSIYKRGNQKP
jgi:hypothetical protein